MTRKLAGVEHTGAFYATMIGATLFSGAIYLLIWKGLGFPQDKSYYVVVLTFLLIHYFYDHFLFREFGTVEVGADARAA